MLLTAFWHSHVYWVLLVLRLHHCHRACSMYQPRLKLGDRVEIWPAHGAGKLASVLYLTQSIYLSIQIYFDAVGKHGTLGLMSLLFIVQFLMGLSITVAASRQAWAFSRDGALPFSRFFRPISQKFGYIPLRTIWGCVFLAAILGLLSLIAPAAAQALFSLAVAGNNLAWGTPIFARVVWGQKKFKPGPFYTGDRFSVPIAWTAITFLVFGTLLSMFPVEGPNPTRTSSPLRFVIICTCHISSFSICASFPSLPHPRPQILDIRVWTTDTLHFPTCSTKHELHRRYQLSSLVRCPGLLLYRRAKMVHGTEDHSRCGRLDGRAAAGY